jgi:formate-dependent phosphoribosylglycinamide formyltransferase (GAR transformylase)
MTGPRRLKSREYTVLIVAAKWWAVSARQAIAFKQQACRVEVVCPHGHPLTYVHGVDRIWPYVGTASLPSLRSAIDASAPDLIVPCDDGVVEQLHMLYAQAPSYRPVIERSLGSASGYSIVESRLQLSELARELNVPVPRMRAINSAQDLLEWNSQLGSAGVLKVDGESGGNGVRICRTLAELQGAWRALGKPVTFMTALKRLTIDRDPLALWSRRSHAQRPVVVQEFIQGSPANSMVACLRGEVLASVAVAVLASDGPTGASFIVQRMQNEVMNVTAKRIAARLQLTGFYGFDFIIQADTETPYLIEMNPRCTQLGHLEFAQQSSLISVLVAKLRGMAPVLAKRVIRTDTIAFFPQTLAAGTKYAQLVENCYHDMPIGEPELVAELSLPSWPSRRWAARLYHALRPARHTAPVTFEMPVASTTPQRASAPAAEHKRAS